MATNWEFRIIYHTSPFIYGIEETKEAIENQIEDHFDLIGVQKLSLGEKIFWIYRPLWTATFSGKMGTLTSTSENLCFRAYVYSCNNILSFFA